MANHFKATYFKLKDWAKWRKVLSRKEMWEINKTFLKQQLKQGKEIIFSHNLFKELALKAEVITPFKQELEFLRDMGYTFEKHDWVWKTVLK